MTTTKLTPSMLADLLKVLRDGGVKSYSDEQITLELYREVVPEYENDSNTLASTQYADPYDNPDLYPDGVVPTFDMKKISER